MASMKDERDESENDEMEHESGESDKSSSSTDSSDDDSDGSEMDMEECEKRRVECIDNLADMERQFIVLREQLYRERITQIKTKLEEVSVGTAKEYCEPLEELQENMRVRIEVAGELRKFRLQSIDKCYLAEDLAAKQNFENEKRLLFDSMKEELEEKIRRLEEERNSADFHSATVSQTEKEKPSQSSGKGRGSWRKGLRPEPGRRKPVSVTGPYIVYMLTDEEIMEDWTIIKKALSTSNRTSERKSFSRYT